jgi:c(7)-type cytochrome triheme protein
MSSCKKCHVLGLATKRRTQRSGSKWSVRASFDHAKHESEPLFPDKNVPCSDCHTQMSVSSSLLTVPTPAKRACIRCHNGDAAFKVTGTGCSKCHSTKR